MRSGSPARRRLTPALLVMAMVAALLPLGQAATAATNTALQFNGTNAARHVRTTTTLHRSQLTNFTLETLVQAHRHGGHRQPARVPAGFDRRRSR